MWLWNSEMLLRSTVWQDTMNAIYLYECADNIIGKIICCACGGLCSKYRNGLDMVSM